MKATSEKEVRFLEKDESEYFKTVCPYCDKRFCQPYFAKKHIKFEHEQAPFKCDVCEKTFHSEKAKSYHEKTNTQLVTQLLSATFATRHFSLMPF